EDMFPKPKQLLPTQQISIIFFGEADLSAQRQFFNVLSNPNSANSLTKLEAFFNKEYTRFSGDHRPAVRLLSHEPGLTSRSLSTHPDVTQLLRSPKIFDFFNEEGFRAKLAADASVMVYFYPFDPSSKRNPAFPEEFSARNESSPGL